MARKQFRQCQKNLRMVQKSQITRRHAGLSYLTNTMHTWSTKAEQRIFCWNPWSTARSISSLTWPQIQYKSGTLSSTFYARQSTNAMVAAEKRFHAFKHLESELAVETIRRFDTLVKNCKNQGLLLSEDTLQL